VAWEGRYPLKVTDPERNHCMSSRGLKMRGRNASETVLRLGCGFVEQSEFLGKPWRGEDVSERKE